MKDPRFHLDAVEAAEIDELSEEARRVREELTETIDALAAKFHLPHPGLRASRLGRAGLWMLGAAVAAGLVLAAARYGPRIGRPRRG